MGVMRFDSNSPGGRRPTRRGVVLAALLSLAAWTACGAQDAAGGSELPEARHLAAALSDPESRDDTLLTLLASLRMRDRARSGEAATAAELAERFRTDRAWLGRLSDRYVALPTRSPVLDPSSWFLLQELDQYQRVPGPGSSPLGPLVGDLLDRVFDAADERVAATLLPEVLSRAEPQATRRWQDLLDAGARDAALGGALTELAEEWYEPWMAAEPPAPAAAGEDAAAVEQGAEFLRQITAMTLHAGPPDALRLKSLRYSLHNALPALDGAEARDAGYLLILGAAINGLYSGEYLPLTESLLWVSSGLLLEAQRQMRLDAFAVPPVAAPRIEPPSASGEAGGDSVEGEAAGGDSAIEVADAPQDGAPQDGAPAPYVSPLPRALSDLLPALSAAFSPEFARVDPRIGATLAVVFDAVQYFNAGQPDLERLRILLSATADTVAQWVLLVPDMSYYYDQPVRGPVGGAIIDCIGAVAAAGAGDEPSAAAVDACLAGLSGAARTTIRSAELSGDPDGPFGIEQLQRELLLAPWQRINYLLGYLQQEVAADCRLPDEPLPNPLEWSNLVTAFDWFARSAPYRFRNDANRVMLRDLRAQGTDLLAALARQADCIGGSGAGATDPVSRGLADYRMALNQLIASLREAELAFRTERLEPGADVVLSGGAVQSTGYRPEDLVIGPCEEQNVCEMRGPLEASPALLERFPDAYLLADQARLGEIEICYDSVQWVERRAEPVRADDPHVANYHGRLAFDLVGRYREGDRVHDVFGFTYTSPDEYHYLFGPATEEVLNDACPTEWIGTRIVTGLGGQNRIRVVPDRLTYLTAARSVPSRIIGSNWARGQQWRAAFETGTGVRARETAGDPALAERLDQHLQGLYEAEQAILYNALFTQPERGWRLRSDSLYDRLAELDARKALVAAHINLLYPQSMTDSDAIRGLLEGRAALLDERLLRQFRREGVPVTEVHADGIARLERMTGEWGRLPESLRRTGSVGLGVAHALVRLAALERDIFERMLPGEYAPLSFDDLDG
jgi:hypothetical protein